MSTVCIKLCTMTEHSSPYRLFTLRSQREINITSNTPLAHMLHAQSRTLTHDLMLTPTSSSPQNPQKNHHPHPHIHNDPSSPTAERKGGKKNDTEGKKPNRKKARKRKRKKESTHEETEAKAAT